MTTTTRTSRRRALTNALLVGGGLGAAGLAVAARDWRGGPKRGQTVDLRDHDPDPDDASPALTRAVGALRRAGGGTLVVPPGTWRLTRPVVIDVPDASMVGAGVRATRLVQPDPMAGPVIRIEADGVSVARLTASGSLRAVDDATAPDALPHGIRVGGGARDVRLVDLVVEDAAGYGIGFQPAGGRERRRGVFDGFVLTNVAILGCGQDGIDMKNFDREDPSCALEGEPVPDCNGRGSFLRGVTVDRHGQLAGSTDRKSGIDVRGERQLELIEVLDVGPRGIGVHLRTDLGGYPNGRGALGSTVQNVFVASDVPMAGLDRPTAVANPDVPGCQVVAVSERFGADPGPADEGGGG